MEVDVEVYCQKCTEDGEEAVEMKGAEECYENVQTGTQSRNFTCQKCGAVVCVTLTRQDARKTKTSKAGSGNSDTESGTRTIH